MAWFKSAVNGVLGGLGYRLVSLGTWRANVPSDFTWIRKRGIRTFIDIGAHVGEYSQFARREFPEARILAFEPLSSCATVLRELAARLGRMDVFEMALGDRNGEVSLNRTAHAPSSSLLPPSARLKESFPETGVAATETVQMKRLDDAVRPDELEKAVFIKINVQGFEDKVLAGATRTLERADILQIEVSFQRAYDGQPLFDDLYAWLKARHFEFSGARSQLFDPRDGTPLQMHAYFARNTGK